MKNTLSCLILGLGFLIFIIDGTGESFSGHGREDINCNPNATHDSVSNCLCQGGTRVTRSTEFCCERKNVNMNNSFYHSDCRDYVDCGPNAVGHITLSCKCDQGSRVVSRSNEIYCDNFNDTGSSGDGSSSGSSGDNACHPFATHYNIYRCTCHEGYRVVLQSDELHCNKIPYHCQESNTVCFNATKSDDYCSLVESTFHLFKSVCENDRLTTASLEATAVSFENYLVNSSLQNIKVKEDLISGVNVVLQRLGSTAVTVALASPERQPQTVVINSVAIQTNIINKGSISKNETFRLEVKGDGMAIHPRAMIDGTTKGLLAVAFISYSGLKSVLRGSFLQNETLLGNEILKVVRVNSRVVSATTSSFVKNISSPVNLTFHHLENNVAQENVICVHWNSASRGGAWSPEGCQHLHSNGTHSTCSCRFLPNFAVLMAITPKEGDPILVLIGYIGLIILLICLFLTIVTFLLCPSSQNKSTFIHLQLSLCLFFADLLFIIGSNKTHNKVLCSVIAGMLQYLFLACFVWMFLEGVNLYLIVRNLKVANHSGASKNVKISMYVCGYGISAMIVAISSAINPSAYGTPSQCWLSPEKGFIWSFLGPVCAIIVINLVLYCLILKNLHEKFRSLNSDVTAIKNTRLLTFKAIAHVFILGVTWCLGLFQFGAMAVVMAYLFTLLNSVQGVFIFLVHCLLNKKAIEHVTMPPPRHPEQNRGIRAHQLGSEEHPSSVSHHGEQVRETYWHWISCSKDTKTPVSELSMTTVPISSPMKSEQNTGLVAQQTVTWKE